MVPLAFAAAIPAFASQSARGQGPVLTVGERLTYDAKYDGPLVVSAGGRGTMEVVGIDTVRGRLAYHVVFSADGGPFFFRVRYKYESWIDVERFVSLRFWQDQTERSRVRAHHFEIFPERAVFSDGDKPERPSISDPLDEASLLYAIRAMPLDSGGRYDIPRYFIPDRNPVTLVVKRRQKVKVPAGTFDAIVVQPLIKTKGIFAEGGHAEAWFSDDEHRYLVKLTARVPFGTLILLLRSIDVPNASGR